MSEDIISALTKKYPALIAQPGKKIKPPHGFAPINDAQYQYITSAAPNLWFWGNRGGGKACKLSTMIPTPTGFETMGSIAVGARVLDEHGVPCRVTWKSEPHIDDWGTYRLTFDDGSEVVCGGHHEWLTFSKRERDRLRKRTPEAREIRRQKRPSTATKRKSFLHMLKPLVVEQGQVRTTREIVESLTYVSGTYVETNHAVPLADAWVLPEADLPIHPYVLGAWLGDGSKNNAQITSMDEEILARIEACGYVVTGVASSLSVPSMAGTFNIVGLSTQLRALGLRKNKRIPEAYRLASADQRLELLRGLMDTDGTCGQDGQATFTNTNVLLARGVYQVAASLGLKPHWREDRATLYGKDCGPCFDVSWTSTLQVFTLPRKAARVPKAVRRTQQFRFIVKAERVADEPVQCIEVDSPSHLYLVEEAGIPTHNSVTARWTCHARALSYPGYRYAILRTSFPELIKNHLIYLKAEMESLGGTYNASKFIVEYSNGSMGLFMQAETDEQTRNALGVELMEVVFDEAPTFKWEHMMMISSSVRVPANSGLTPLKRFNGNPIGPCIDDIWKYFIDKDVDREEDPEYRPEDWQSIYIDMRDNTELDVDAYKKQLGAGLPPHLRAAWLDGRRVETNQLFELKPTVNVEVVNPETQTIETEIRPYHVITELPTFPDKDGRPVSVLEQPWVRILGGYDDGYIDPAVMLWFVVVGSQVICFNERSWQHTSSPDIAREALDACVVLRADGTPYQLPMSTIYADPTIAKQTTAVQSTQEVMEAMWRCLVHGPVKKRCCNKARALTFEPSTNDRALYASAIHRMLQAEVGPNKPRIQFLKPDPATSTGRDLISRGIVGCPYLLKSLPKMVYDEHNAQKMAPHKQDHPVCSLAYFSMSYPTTTAPSIESTRPAWWSDYFIAGTNIPIKQATPKTRR